MTVNTIVYINTKWTRSFFRPCWKFMLKLLLYFN